MKGHSPLRKLLRAHLVQIALFRLVEIKKDLISNCEALAQLLEKCLPCSAGSCGTFVAVTVLVWQVHGTYVELFTLLLNGAWD